MFLPLLILSILTISFALPNGVIPQNVITVPPNCPTGQEFINGECRDIWRSGLTTPLPPSLIHGKNVTPMNMVTVPTNCPPGQELINGQCRDVWKQAVAYGNNESPTNMVTVPANCPPGQELINGQCRDVWKQAVAYGKNESPTNMVTVPTNCPPGQELINGQCRDVWKQAVADSKLFEMLLKKLLARSTNNELSRCEDENGNENNLLESSDSLKNIISVPTQCPAGYRPDALGICRKIF